ncbi:hypothetical protein IPG41_02055 [Candidatus Peregrinibacteria bacterium]|nr:MAG: hypothetical protein IPG41_02055 [Candidatus Peregrinibacteria bacterium]
MLLSLVVFGWIHMNWDGFSVFSLHPQNEGYLDLLNALVAGTLYGYLIPHSYFLLSLIPIPKKGQSASEKKRELKCLTKILCDNFFSEHPSTKLLIGETLLLVLLLASNYVYHWVQPLILVNLILLILPVLKPLMRISSN